MSRLFMYATPLGEIEQLMMMAPNFSPRRSGIIINNYFNCQGGCIKCSCSENIKGFSRYTDICFYLVGREGDEIKYRDLVQIVLER